MGSALPSFRPRHTQAHRLHAAGYRRCSGQPVACADARRLDHRREGARNRRCAVSLLASGRSGEERQAPPLVGDSQRAGLDPLTSRPADAGRRPRRAWPEPGERSDHVIDIGKDSIAALSTQSVQLAAEKTFVVHGHLQYYISPRSSAVRRRQLDIWVPARGAHPIDRIQRK